MRGGKLDRVVIIEKRTRPQGPTGELVDAWEPVGHPQFGEYIKAKGVEKYLGAQLAASVMGAFRLRWFPNLLEIFPDTHRVTYTPIGASAPVTCLIKGTTEINRREGVIVYWEGRAENPDSDIPDADED